MGWAELTVFNICALQLLLSYTATNCNLQGDLGNTPLILASSINNCEALNTLVCTGISVFPASSLDNNERACAALHLMKLCLHVSLSSHWSKLKHGAKLCKQNKLGHFPMHAAAFAGAKKAMEVILKAGMTKKMIYHQKRKC